MLPNAPQKVTDCKEAAPATLGQQVGARARACLLAPGWFCGAAQQPADGPRPELEALQPHTRTQRWWPAALRPTGRPNHSFPKQEPAVGPVSQTEQVLFRLTPRTQSVQATFFYPKRRNTPLPARSRTSSGPPPTILTANLAMKQVHLKKTDFGLLATRPEECRQLRGLFQHAGLVWLIMWAAG